MFGDIHYVISADHALLACSGNWSEFARENDADDLARFPEGESLLDNIADPQLQALHLDVLDQLAASPHHAFVMPFRCDGPDVLRAGVWKASAITCGLAVLGVFIESRIVTERERRRRVECLARFRRVESHWPEAAYCSTCGKIRAPQIGGVWLDFDEYYSARGDDAVRVKQAICESCVADFRTRLAM